MSGWERKHLRRYLVTYTPGRDDRSNTTRRIDSPGTYGVVTKSRLAEIREETVKNPRLKKVTKCIIEGWPNSKDNLPNDKKSYWSFREELSIINGILFKGKRLLIPEVMRNYNGPH